MNRTTLDRIAFGAALLLAWQAASVWTGPESISSPILVLQQLYRWSVNGVLSANAGYTLLAAHDVLEAELGRAIQRHARLVLLVTGRPPRDSTERIDGRPVRGAIRASIGDWLHHSRHSSHIAAVRSAHPRHGGAGALYVILRRTRG